MKFDVVVGNPPYFKNLHLDFLKIAYNISKRFIIWVHPSAWIIDEREKNNDIKELIKNNIIDMKKYKFINDYKEDRKFIFWRLKFPENMVNQDSIAPRIKRILNCKDTIDRRTMFDIGE